MTDRPICGYPLPGWRLHFIRWSEECKVWVACVKREDRDFNFMAQSSLGPLEAWEAVLKLASNYKQ